MTEPATDASDRAARSVRRQQRISGRSPTGPLVAERAARSPPSRSTRSVRADPHGEVVATSDPRGLSSAIGRRSDRRLPARPAEVNEPIAGHRTHASLPGVDPTLSRPCSFALTSNTDSPITDDNSQTCRYRFATTADGCGRWSIPARRSSPAREATQRTTPRRPRRGDREHRRLGLVDVGRIRVPATAVEIDEEHEAGPGGSLVAVGERMVPRQATGQAPPPCRRGRGRSPRRRSRRPERAARSRPGRSATRSR